MSHPLRRCAGCDHLHTSHRLGANQQLGCQVFLAAGLTAGALDSGAELFMGRCRCPRVFSALSEQVVPV